MYLSDSQYEELLDLAEAGLYKKAWERSDAIGHWKSWEGTRDRVLAGRLLAGWGSYRTAAAVHIRAYRADPHSPETAYYYARHLWDHRGPLDALHFVQKLDLPSFPIKHRSEILTLLGAVHATLRDFDEAERYNAEAIRINPNYAWLYVCQAWWLKLEDRLGDAMRYLETALQIKPWCRPAVELKAHYLSLQERDEETIRFLHEASEHLESCTIHFALSDMYQELERYSDALIHLDQALTYMPMRDKYSEQEIAQRRSEIFYFLDDYEAAKRYAIEGNHPYFKQIHANLTSASSDAKRTVLPVRFIKQRHLTCAPATAASLGNYWSLPFDHEKIAEEVCYDGTPNHRLRNWAEKNGCLVREFTMTWEATQTLIERGVPFAVSTAEPNFAHLQAVIGYDARRGTLSIRDPSVRPRREALAAEFFERYLSVGPRAIVFIPRDREELLNGLGLPDEKLHDHLHGLCEALSRHQREEAAVEAYAICEQAPNHRLFHESRLALAYYDRDPEEQFKAVDALVTLFPDSVIWNNRKISLSRYLGKRQQAIECIDLQFAKERPDPVFLHEKAMMLREECRTEEAMKWIRKAIRYEPATAYYYGTLGHLLWDEGKWEEALSVYRMASCLDDKDESLAESYFAAGRFLQKTRVALTFLMRRFRRYGKKSAGPAYTLFSALESIGETPKGLKHLRRAMKFRPDDGELMLYAARSFARWGYKEEASKLIERAKSRCRESSWLRGAADIRTNEGDLAESLHLWRKVLEWEPLAMDAHFQVASRLKDLEGLDAAIAHLDKFLERFPHHVDLHIMRTEWLRGDDPSRPEESVRQLLALHPDNSWARRELAIQLDRQNRLEEALEESKKAVALDAQSTYAFSIQGAIFIHLGRRDEAAAAFHRALELSADNVDAAYSLVNLHESLDRRREELLFVYHELKKQVTFGNGIEAFRYQAKGILSPETVLDYLRSALESRSDLWQSWNAVASHLIEMQRYDEAMQTLKNACERFPLNMTLWLTLAELCYYRLDAEGELAALQKAAEASPGVVEPLRRLADYYDRKNEFEQSREIARQAVALEPNNPICLGYYADALWKTGQREKAIDALRNALKKKPDYGWAWSCIEEWSQNVDDNNVCDDLAREITRLRPKLPLAWLTLARILSKQEDIQERLDAIEKAIELDPHSEDAYDYKAFLLVGLGRYDEAYAACRPALWADSPPRALRGRKAWITARQGDIETAIEEMKTLLVEDPAYFWGWDELCEWYEKLQQWERVVEASEKVLELSPHNMATLQRRSYALYQLGKTQEAKETLQKLVQIAPGYAPASNLLSSILIADGQTDEFVALVEQIHSHLPESTYHLNCIQVARLQKDKSSGRIAFKKLISCANATSDELNTATNVMKDLIKQKEIIQTLQDHVRTHPANVEVVKILIHRLLSSKRLDDALEILRLVRDRRTIWIEAVYQFIDSSLGTDDNVSNINYLLHREKSGILDDVQLWGEMGRAYYVIGKYKKCVAWLADWNTNPGVAPWMLNNLSLSLIALKRFHDMEAVNRHALAMPHDHTRNNHEILSFLLSLVNRNNELARKCFDNIRSKPKTLYYEIILAFGQELLDLRENGQRPNANKKSAFFWKWREKMRLYYPQIKKNRYVWPVFKWFLFRFVCESPNWAVKLYCLEKLFFLLG